MIDIRAKGTQGEGEWESGETGCTMGLVNRRRGRMGSFSSPFD